MDESIPGVVEFYVFVHVDHWPTSNSASSAYLNKHVRLLKTKIF